MADTLGIHPAQATGHLHFFWWWCIDYAPDGSLERFSPPQIAKAAGWDGDPEVFLRCLISCGLVDRDPLHVHDWLDFCGDLVKKRLEYKSAKRRRTKRLRISLRNSDNSQRNPDISQRTVTNSTIPTVPTKPGTAIRHLDFVFLTPEEHGKLKAALGGGLEAYLARLNGYIGQIGEAKAAAKYKSHYYTILNWHRKDKAEGTHGTNVSAGISGLDPEKIRAAGDFRRDSGLRKDASAGAILNRVRNLQASGEAEPKAPSGTEDTS